MSKKLLSTLIASLFVAGPAFAQSGMVFGPSDDPMRVGGSATLGGIYNNQDATNSAKLEEYQDFGNGALSSVLIRGRNSRYWFDGYGENFGRSDQYMFLRGGQFDVFKVGAYLSDMPHNFADPAVTPYAGVGSGLLIANFPQINPGNWNSFRLGYDRRDAGGFFEWSKNSPFYFRVDGNQVEFDGTKVGAAANGTSPGNGYVDLPFPNNSTTNNFGVEGGYQSNLWTLALRYDYSKYSNSIEQVNWSNPFWGNRLDTSYLAPDNEFNKFTATANYRGLPWNSVISARYTWSQAESTVGLGTQALNSAVGTGFTPTLPQEENFNGEHVTQTFQASWTAAPMKGVDTRVYYFWTELENNSTLVEFGNAPTTPLASGLGCGTQPGLTPGSSVVGNCDNELYHYTKNNAGFDAYWRFMRGNRVGFGWDWIDLDQERFDYNSMEQNKFFIEYKNTMFDTWSGRLKYTYIDRDSSYNLSNAGTSPNDNNWLLRYTTAFDMQSLESNQFKLNLDWTPLQFTSVSFEGQWKDTDYKGVTLGRTSDKRQEYYVSATYARPESWSLTVFGDWEEVKYPSNHRYIGNSVCTTSGTTIIPPNCFDPATPPTNGAYNWSSQTKDENWSVGVGFDWPVTPQWLVKASYMYMKTDGQADFSAQTLANGAPIPNLTYPINIGNFDDTKNTWFQLKGIYTLNKNWAFTLGYAYQKWEYSDVGYDGYQNFVPYPPVATNASLSYLNGYGANTNGSNNIFYALASFTFDPPPLPAPKVAQAPAPAPVVAAAPPPPPAPAPAPKPAPTPQVQKITLDSKVLFDFDKAVLKPDGAAAIDSQVVGKLSQIQKLEVVLVSGHTDPLGTEAYNQKLSERRADAVRDYLVSKGVPKNKIETLGLGEKQLVVTEKECSQKNLKERIACLQPDRRVEVQAKGESSM